MVNKRGFKGWKAGDVAGIKADAIIGIDPGVETGIAVAIQKEEIKVLTTSFWGCIDEINKLEQLRASIINQCGTEFRIAAVVENPNLNPSVFTRANSKNVSTILKIAQNVGSNKRDATLIIGYLKKLDIPVTEVKPETAKWSEDEFRQRTGIKQKVSQHARDAVKLIWGRL